MLLPGLERQDERPPTVPVGRLPDDAPRQLPQQGFGDDHKTEVRPAEIDRVADRLPVTDGDVRAVLTRRGEHRERQGVADRDEQGLRRRARRQPKRA